MKKTIILFSCICATLLSFAQTADDIINKHADAIGGREKLKAIKNIYMEGTHNDDGQQTTIKCYWILKFGKRIEWNTLGMIDYSITTKDSGWGYSASAGMKAAEPSTAGGVKMAQPDLDSFEPLLDYKELGYKAAYKGKDDVDGSDAYKIELTISDSNVKTYFIDPTTYYIMRIKSRQVLDGVTREGTSDFSNYQKTPEGYWFPMNWVDRGEGYKFSVIKINIDMAPTLFKPKR